jgi:hypothetical protein
MYFLLFELAMLLALPAVALPSQLKKNIMHNNTLPVNQTTSVPPSTPKHFTWDGLFNALFRRVFRFLVELEIKAMWYKDFFFFDSFQFFL